MSQKYVEISKKRIALSLLIVVAISIIFKMYLIDFSTFPSEDAIGHILHGIGHTNGNFEPIPAKTLGWSIFLSPFFSLMDSENFLEYSNLAKILSVIISISSIFAIYKLGRRFFPQKYALVVASLFAFEPHLNYNSVQGLTEPLYILIFIVSFYFILSQNPRFQYISFVLVGILWWIRWPGIIMLIVISIIFFYNSKISTKSFAKYALCIGLFLLIVSPMLINRNNEFGDPLYFDMGSKFFTGEFSTLQSEDTVDLEYSAIDFINEKGIFEFFDRFLLTGIVNVLEQLARIAFPYLIILLPLGIIFSFRAFDQNSKFIKSNWILILVTLGAMVVTFAVIPERRFLYYLFPFLIIFATIPIQRLVEYGLSTFSFSNKQKNYSLIVILAIVIILSSTFMLRYDTEDSFEQKEKLIFAEFLMNNLSGKIVDSGNSLEGMSYAKLSDVNTEFRDVGSNGMFKNILKDDKLEQISLSGNSLEDFILNGERYELKYISINKDGVTEIWYPYLNKIFNNEEKYPFLKKIVDSRDLGLTHFDVKVFEIDYEKFHQLKSQLEL